MGHKAGGAPEEAEARDLPEEVIEGLARRAANVLTSYDCHACRGFSSALLGASSCDDDGLQVRR
jgi:hypothetical protein